MDRMKVFVCATVVAMVMGFVMSASAQEEETTQQVDWEDAAYYAELMDTFVNDDGVLMATYYDEAQNVLWSQPASLKLEEATALLSSGTEQAGALLISQWVVPTALWMCDNDEGDDRSCTGGTNYKWGLGHFDLIDVDGNWAYYLTDDSLSCYMNSIERIYSSGASGVYNYCAGYGTDYDGWVSDSDGYYWSYADDQWCSLNSGAYRYYIDDSSHIDDVDFNNADGFEVALFGYKVSGQYYYTVVVVRGCLQ